MEKAWEDGTPLLKETGDVLMENDGNTFFQVGQSVIRILYSWVRYSIRRGLERGVVCEVCGYGASAQGPF